MTEFPWDKKPWLSRMGIHAPENAPHNGTEDERLVYALLEALDFECWKYGDAPSWDWAAADRWDAMTEAAGTLVTITFKVSDHKAARAAATVERFLRPVLERLLRGPFGRFVESTPQITARPASEVKSRS